MGFYIREFFFELYNIMVNKVIFVGFMKDDRPNCPLNPSLFPSFSRNLDNPVATGVFRRLRAGLSRCNSCSFIGPRASGGPRHGVWVGCSFLPDTPGVREFSRSGF